MNIPHISAEIKKQYLNYLGLDECKPSRAFLNDLVRNHAYKIPWENFLLREQGTLETNVEILIHRITQEHLGGVCTQLNLCFAALLQSLGFSVTLHACVIHGFEDKPYETPRMTHLTPVVVCEHETLLAEIAWVGLADVLVMSEKAPQAIAHYRVYLNNTGNYVLQFLSQDQWFPQFEIFSHPLRLDEWLECIDYSQPSADRVAANHRVFIKVFPEGRVIIKDNKITIVDRNIVNKIEIY
jgi:arylamine N-acetyltransferase